MAAQGYSKPPYSPTRFPGGITNANVGEVLENFAALDPTKLQVFFEDFITPPAALGTFTGIAGAGGLATVATTNAVDTPTACFRLDPTKRFFFKAKLSLATVANTILVGFADALSSPTGGVTVTIANNVLTLAIVGGASAGTKAVNVSTANATMYEIGIAYNPNKDVVAYLNNVPVASLPATAFVAADLVAGILPTGATATVDYIFAAVERAPVN